MLCGAGVGSPSRYANESEAGAVERAPGGAAMVKVAVTVGLGETPAALKVRKQVWVPVAVAPAGFTEATIVTGVEPPPGASVSQAQSEPGAVVKASPLEGLVLVTVIFCPAGTVPPTV